MIWNKESLQFQKLSKELLEGFNYPMLSQYKIVWKSVISINAVNDVRKSFPGFLFQTPIRANNMRILNNTQFCKEWCRRKPSQILKDSPMKIIWMSGTASLSILYLSRSHRQSGLARGIPEITSLSTIHGLEYGKYGRLDLKAST